MFVLLSFLWFQSNANEWRNLEDVFKPVAAISLETLDICLIGKIREIVWIEPYLFILDEQSGIVYQFHKDGHFVRKVGEIGLGPGEYLHASSIRKVYDDHLGLFDQRTAQVKVYDHEGTFIHETPRQSSLKIVARSYFIWPEKDRLYLAGYNAYPREPTWHLITNADVSKRVAAFGEYEPQESGKPPLPFHCFIQVGEHLWTGSPYHHRIDIFDLEGNAVTSFYQPNPNAKIGDYYERGYIYLQGQRIKLSEYNPKPISSRFATFGDYVFTRCAFVANVFKPDFTHVKTLNGGRFSYLNYSGPYAITQTMEEPVESLIENMQPQERILLEDAGWFKANHGEDNPFLIFWQVKQ